MMTRGEAIVKDAKNIRNRMNKLGLESFSRSDLSELIEPFTSRLEYFLKAVVFPTCSRRTSLKNLIDNLENIGMQPADITTLHELRLLYNISKHNPDMDLKWRECVETFILAIGALESISDLRVASVDAPFEQSFSTVIYVGFWDHYAGGETEVGLFLPSEHWLGTTPISTFHLQMSSWEFLKQLLIDHPCYSRGELALGSSLWKSFSKDGDFLDAGIWEGDVQELLMLLSCHNDEELEQDVIPFLARRNNLASIGIAIVSAAVDVARADPTAAGEPLQIRISERAKHEYAAEVETPYGQTALLAVVALLEGVPHEQRVALGGPAFRLNPNKAAEQSGLPVKLDGSTFVWLIT